MSGQRATPDGDQRVVRLRPRAAGRRLPLAAPPPLADLAKYERTDAPDDYRHRMLVNAATFLFVLGLIGAGLWLAESMAELRRNQDCVLAGHRNCVPIEAGKQR
jgi:hypothetical protein